MRYNKRNDDLMKFICKGISQLHNYLIPFLFQQKSDRIHKGIFFKVPRKEDFMQEMKNAGIYIRVSTEDQVRERIQFRRTGGKIKTAL